jgi:hypothetical protein
MSKGIRNLWLMARCHKYLRGSVKVVVAQHAVGHATDLNLELMLYLIFKKPLFQIVL